MSGPPPPPPPGPPPPNFSLPKSSGGGGADERGALLKSIRAGAKLKKTVTVDKSAPLIPGKANSVAPNNSGSSGGSATTSGSFAPPMPNGIALGGLFAGGMPKLKPTGRLGTPTINASSPSLNSNDAEKSPSSKIPLTKNFTSVQDQLKRQLHNPSDTRTRGPPPPAPMRNISVDESKSMKSLSLVINSNGYHPNQTSLHANVSSLHTNSSLHRKSKSNANLSALDCIDNVNSGGYQPSKPVINHGKPNLAPKPPTLNGKPTPPTKLVVKPNKTISRAQSMRTPRSPSPQSPTANNDASIKFGTVRNMSSLLIGQSLTNLNSQNSSSPRQRPPLTGRPSVPPPSIPPPATPPTKLTNVKPPNHAPPPPPPGLPQPPSHAPPPPPSHKTHNFPQPSRPPPAIPTNNNNNNANPPPPPPRHSSMKDVHHASRRIAVDLEEKFKFAFSSPDRFPRPPPYRNVLKLYSNRQVTSKQQAPLPPQLLLQPTGKAWNSTSTC